MKARIVSRERSELLRPDWKILQGCYRWRYRKVTRARGAGGLKCVASYAGIVGRLDDLFDEIGGLFIFRRTSFAS